MTAERLHRRLLVALLGPLAGLAAMAAVMYFYDTKAPRPEVPTGWVLIADRVIGCTQPFLPEVYAEGYAPTADWQYSALTVYGRLVRSEAGFTRVPVVWIFYKEVDEPQLASEAPYIIITEPGKPAVYATYEGLKAAYSTVCSLHPLER